MVKKIIFGGMTLGILLASCKSGPTENPKQIGNRERLDIFHQQKKVKLILFVLLLTLKK